MARTSIETKNETFDLASLPSTELEAIKEENNAVAAADAVIMGSFDAIKALGRIEAMQFSATVAEKVIAETAISIKKSKKYKDLPYQDKNGNLRRVATFEEYCDAFLGKSYRRVMDLISNYNLLGSDLYEQAEMLGFRQKDYNALKALPADDRQIIAQAIESESLDNALDLMQQLAAKHQREKEKSAIEIADLKGNLGAMEARLKKKDDDINKLDHELERLRLDRPQGAHVNWPESFRTGYFEQLAVTRKNIKHALGSLDLIRQDAMKIEPGSEAEEASLNQAKEVLAAELVSIHNECAEMLEALGMSFDRTLGAYSDARIRWLAQP